MPSPTDCSMIARIGFAVLGVVLGLSVACVFGAVYHNYNAAVWGLVSGVVAALTLYVHVAYVKRWYEEDPGPFRTWLYCGCFFQLTGLCSFIVYIVLAVHDGQGVVIYGAGYYLACVWSFMTLKWGLQLFLFSRFYWRRIVGATLLLLAPEKATLAENYGSSDKC